MGYNILRFQHVVRGALYTPLRWWYGLLYGGATVALGKDAALPFLVRGTMLKSEYINSSLNCGPWNGVTASNISEHYGLMLENFTALRDNIHKQRYMYNAYYERMLGNDPRWLADTLLELGDIDAYQHCSLCKRNHPIYLKTNNTLVQAGIAPVDTKGLN